MAKVRLSITIDDLVYLKLQKLKATKAINVSAFVNRAIIAYLKEVQQ